MDAIRHDWTLEQAQKIYAQPFNDLLFQAQQTHRAHFDPNKVQISTLLSIKTGACPENCAYCPQSGHYDTGVQKEKLMDLETVKKAALKAKDEGATRFCMGASYRTPNKKEFPHIVEMVKLVNSLGMESCLTIGMLNQEQVDDLAEVGLHYYNHNLDTSKEYYDNIITSHTYQDRIDTLDKVRESSIKVCCGGIVGMGESTDDRLKLLLSLAEMNPHPESVPLNKLIQIHGTPLENQESTDPIDFVRMVATARILLPTTYVRLSAGRNTMSDEMQAMCFFAGANSIHYGKKLLVTALPATHEDQALFKRLGITALSQQDTKTGCAERVNA